jgi:hypothetical protein
LVRGLEAILLLPCGRNDFQLDLHGPDCGRDGDDDGGETSMIKTENAEWVTVRTAMRGLNALVDDLEDGAREKVVLTTHGKTRVVVVSIEEYARLRRKG